MNVNGTNIIQLTIFCSVEEHDANLRRELLEQLKRTGVSPEFAGDKIEFRYRGGRETALRLVEYAESHKVRSISITSVVK